MTTRDFKRGYIDGLKAARRVLTEAFFPEMTKSEKLGAAANAVFDFMEHVDYGNWQDYAIYADTQAGTADWAIVRNRESRPAIVTGERLKADWEWNGDDDELPSRKEIVAYLDDTIGDDELAKAWP